MKMESHKATVYITTFVVAGTGTFPFDMLRYDSCVPDRSEDASELAWDRTDLKRRQVRLRRYALSKNAGPTEVRWSSFGWTVLRNNDGTLVTDTRDVS